MSKQKIDINVADPVSELVIREGKALPVAPDKSLSITGTLAAPFQFYEGKKEWLDAMPLLCHIQIEKDKGKITLICDESDPHTTHVISGQLEGDSILQQFQINTDHRWTIQEFLKFIKTMRYYFADRAAHAALVKSIQQWSVKVERVITEFNDNKGNSNFQFQTKVQQSAENDGLISKFDLNIPLFQGYQKTKFTVEIGLDPRNIAVDLYLISDDLVELEIMQREKLLEEELKKFDEFPCSKIVLSGLHKYFFNNLPNPMQYCNSFAMRKPLKRPHIYDDETVWRCHRNRLLRALGFVFIISLGIIFIAVFLIKLIQSWIDFG